MFILLLKIGLGLKMNYIPPSKKRRFVESCGIWFEKEVSLTMFLRFLFLSYFPM